MFNHLCIQHIWVPLSSENIGRRKRRYRYFLNFFSVSCAIFLPCRDGVVLKQKQNGIIHSPSKGDTLYLVYNCSKSPAQWENWSFAFVTRDNTSLMWGKLSSKVHLKREGGLFPAENEESWGGWQWGIWYINFSFCFNLKECRDALSGILQAGAVFLAFPQAPSVTSGKFLVKGEFECNINCLPKCKIQLHC